MQIKRSGSQASQAGSEAFATQEALNGSAVTWMEKVTDAQYQGRRATPEDR